VPLAEAQALASVVAFSGGSVIFSDDVTTLEKAGGGFSSVAPGVTVGRWGEKATENWGRERTSFAQMLHV